MKNIIALRNNFVNLSDAGQENLQMAMSVNHQLMTYGYMFDQSAFDMVKRADTADIVEFHNEVVGWLKEITGGKHNFRSLYGNFPNDVMSMSQAELWFNQIIHYWTACTFAEVGKPTDVAFEQVDYRMLTAGSDARFMQVFTDLCSVNQSLTPQDTAVLKWFANSGLDLVYPSTIPFKENLAVLASILPGFTVKTVTDVLRIAVGFSGGDVSLPAVPKKPKKVGRFNADWAKDREKFKFKLTVDQKTRIVELLESSNLDVREMNQGRKYGRWIRLGEVLGHIDANKYPRTANAFYRLRNQVRKGKPNGEPKVRTWYSDVDRAFGQSFETGLAKLSERAGEFVRRLDWLVRTNVKSEVNIKNILLTLTRVGESASNKVLYEVYTHFENRRKPVQNRSIFVKRARSRTKLPDLPKLPDNIVDAIQDTIINTIKSKFSNLEPMGKCWIDPELKKIPMPTNMRSMSDSLVPVIRGQRVPLNIDKTIRCFVHYTKPRTHITIDLSCVLIGSKQSTIVDWSHHKPIGDLVLHSGDSWKRKGNVAEYIDLSPNCAKAYKWVLLQLNNYTNSPDLLNGAIFGFCEVEFPNANNSWQPDTIVNSFSVKVPGKVNLLLIDLETKEFILIDEEDKGQFVNNISSGDAVKLIGQYSDIPKLSVYDLLDWHVTARGHRSSIEDAETQFTYDDFKTSYVETMKYMGI